MAVSASDLLQLPPEALEVGQGIVLDWYDGPREGFLCLNKPLSWWYYRLYAEARREEDPDDRLYLFALAPDDVPQRLISALAELEPPKERVWVPMWHFSSKEAQQVAEQAVDALIAEIGDPVLLVRSVDLLQLQKLWLLVP